MSDQQFNLFDVSAGTESAGSPPPEKNVPPVEIKVDPAQIPTSAKVAIPAGTYADMDAMTAHCSVCQRCELGATRTHAVVSRGNPNALIMIIGEGPGENEDLTGQPFVGKAGQLLDKILESVELTQDDVFICNIVKCRPPGNRKPTSVEMDACRPYLLEQIRLVNPALILLAGASAVIGVTGDKTGITKIRGQWRDWQGRQCMPVFHPSYLLRNQSRAEGSPKWQMWQDIQVVRQRFDEIKRDRSN